MNIHVFQYLIRIVIEKIVELGIEKYFYKLYISWEDKYKSIEDLAKSLNILEEHILFVDDSEIELTEAKYYIPDFQILNVKNIALLKENESTIEIQYLVMQCEAEGRNIGKNVIEFVKKLAREKNILMLI